MKYLILLALVVTTATSANHQPHFTPSDKLANLEKSIAHNQKTLLNCWKEAEILRHNIQVLELQSHEPYKKMLLERDIKLKKELDEKCKKVSANLDQKKLQRQAELAQKYPCPLAEKNFKKNFDELISSPNKFTQTEFNQHVYKFYNECKEEALRKEAIEVAKKALEAIVPLFNQHLKNEQTENNLLKLKLELKKELGEHVPKVDSQLLAQYKEIIAPKDPLCRFAQSFSTNLSKAFEQ